MGGAQVHWRCRRVRGPWVRLKVQAWAGPVVHWRGRVHGGVMGECRGWGPGRPGLCDGGHAG